MGYIKMKTGNNSLKRDSEEWITSYYNCFAFYKTFFALYFQFFAFYNQQTLLRTTLIRYYNHLLVLNEEANVV